MNQFNIGDSVKATRTTPKRGKTRYYGFIVSTDIEANTVDIEYYRGMPKGYFVKTFNTSEVVHDNHCSKGYVHPRRKQVTAPDLSMPKSRKTKRNIITQSRDARPPNMSVDISHYTIGEFIHIGQTEPTEVHFLVYQKNNPIPISLRFKSPDTLGDLIAELDSARTRVFGTDKQLEAEKTGLDINVTDINMLPQVKINMTEELMQEALNTFVVSEHGQVHEDDLWKPIRELVASEFNAEVVTLSITSFVIDDLIYYPDTKLKHWLECYVDRLLNNIIEPLDDITLLFKDDGYISALEL